MAALRDIFKKKEKEKKEIKPIQKKERGEVILEKPKKPAFSEERPKKTRDKKGLAFGVLKAPQITEKATTLAEKNQYIFKTSKSANKPEVRKAVEDLYGVDVVSVQIINVRRKKRRLGRIIGWRPGYKKAIVKIKAGQKIEIMPR